MNDRPLCVELFCGSFGWSAGFLAEGYWCVGFDIEHLPHHGPVPPSAELVLQDVLTLHGSQFKDAAVIVASPPCQNYSYLAMPWSRSSDWVRPDGDGWQVLNSAAAKEMRERWEREGPDNRLFDACFRIQREAIEAQNCDCGHADSDHDHDYLNRIDDDCRKCSCTRIVKRYIPLIVENVRGAQPWVGRSAWNFGSFHLWGDVPALMPINTKRAMKRNPDGTAHPSGSWFAIADSSQGDRREDGVKQLHSRGDNQTCGAHRMGLGAAGQKFPVYSDPRRNGGKGVHLTSPAENLDGTKIGGDWFRDPACHSAHGSGSSARKAASAQIAKIPFELAQHIASVYHPSRPECAA